jgi:hypothetical protein
MKCENIDILIERKKKGWMRREDYRKGQIRFLERSKYVP